MIILSNMSRPSFCSRPNHLINVLTMRVHTGVDEGRREERGASGRHQAHLSYGEDGKNDDGDYDSRSDGDGKSEGMFTSPPSPRTKEMPSKMPNLGTRLKPTPD
jgi:hypothetical protein